MHFSGPAGGSASQFTRDATSPHASRSSGSPTTTVFVSGTISSTNRRRPAATPSPFRWPTVNRSIPSCLPSTVPSRSAITPAAATAGRRRRTTSVWSPPGTKQISTLSGLSATPVSPASRARARIAGFAYPPTGNKRCGSTSRLMPCST